LWAKTLSIRPGSILLLESVDPQCRDWREMQENSLKNRCVTAFHSVRFYRCFALILLSFLAIPTFAGEWQFSGVNRVVAVTDVHGSYDTMVTTIQKAEVIDENLAWIGGDTHLVITGDILDRGPDSRHVMDLIMRLENEASEAGGRVHQLVGNHEVMNLVGDLRYVSRHEYAAFADEESKEEREQWFRRYRSTQPPEIEKLLLRASFDKLAPPGFFGHRRAFRADGRYGRWLLKKPLIIVIDGTAFVHGGISSYVAEHGLEGVNGTLKTELNSYITELNSLQDQELISPIEAFYDHADVMRAVVETQQLAGPALASAEIVIELNDSSIHGPDSPLWYRGTVGCSELIGGDALQRGLTRIGANRVVIGHTPTITRRVLQRMSGRVIEIDTGMNHAAYKGSGNALVIEGGVLTVVNESGSTSSPPAEHPRRVGYRSAGISADNLFGILSTGEVITAKVSDNGRTLVQISTGDGQVAAVFDEQSRKKGFLPELAAYRLDRMLGLDMVPVTVRREINGKQGTLQFLPASSKTEQERVSSYAGSSAWCPLPQQWNTMYIFDALTYNIGRNPAFMIYSPDNWQLILTKHDQAFKSSKKRPPYLKKTTLKFTSDWVDALRELTDEALNDELGDVLGQRELAALAKRRDLLIQEAENRQPGQ
jgi:calcineurin-like phosphoesterase family protein